MTCRTQNTHLVGVCGSCIGNWSKSEEKYIFGPKVFGKIHLLGNCEKRGFLFKRFEHSIIRYAFLFAKSFVSSRHGMGRDGNPVRCHKEQEDVLNSHRRQSSYLRWTTNTKGE